jgi:hypothetical protein
MPNHLKIVISVIVLVVGAVIFYLDSRAGAGGTRWIAVVLAPLMVGAIWLFPEAKAREIRGEAARRRQQ